MISYIEKRNLENDLLEVVATKLNSGEIDKYDSEAIAKYMIKKIDQISTSDDALEFIEGIAAKWPFFSQVLHIEKEKKGVEMERKKIDEIHESLQNNPIT